MNFSLDDRTIFLVLAGSRAYGFHTEISDYDYRGICITPLDSYLGLSPKFEQIVDTDKSKHVWKHYTKGLVQENSDMQVMELTKFCRLAAGCNPSVIEILFSSTNVILKQDPIMKKLLDKKELFLSKQAKPRFCSYALSQLRKIERHKRWLDNPPKIQPKRTDFNLPEYKLLSLDQLGAAEALIKKEVDTFMIDQTELPEHVKIELASGMSRMMKAVWASMHTDEEYPIGEGKKFGSTEDAVFEAVARDQQFSENFIEVLKAEKKYRAAKQEWDSYQHWLMERNTARAEIEKKYGYDCYVEETEFLTDSGWKKFDEIQSLDKLATVYTGSAKNRPFMGLEYQNYTEKFDGTFTGNLYNFYGNHIDTLVTPNHRMLIQKQERKSKKISNWELLDAAHVPDTFNVVRQITPNKRNFTDKNIFDFKQFGIGSTASLKLMGWYLSDGSMAYNGDKPDDVRISQIKNGKLSSSLIKFVNKYKDKIPCSLYEYARSPNKKNSKYHVEMILSVRGNIPALMHKECGETKNKRIPRWVFKLSKYKMETLLDAMILGDGTIKKRDNSIIYYSSLKNLAEDVQELAFLCGFETSLYGPYSRSETRSDGTVYQFDMYQVHINKTRSQFKTLVRSRNIKNISVTNKKIVCFSVPNSTLVTRLNGHISIHGNCKHAAHLVRLIRMCREILETGQVLVRRPDAEEIRSIRNGAWSYESIVEFAEKEDLSLQEVAKKSSLPNSPPMNIIHETVFEMVMEFNIEKCAVGEQEKLREIIHSLLVEPYMEEIIL